MRDSIGGVFIFNIVILFILLFTGIMCLTINRSKAYQVKDSIISVIEDNEGIYISKSLDYGSNNSVLKEIIDLTSEASYRTTGTCPTGYKGYNREGEISSTEPFLCIKETTVSSSVTSGDYNISSDEKGCYYSIIVFYKLDIPVLKEVFSFSITGETKTLYSDKCGG